MKKVTCFSIITGVSFLLMIACYYRVSTWEGSAVWNMYAQVILKFALLKVIFQSGEYISFHIPGGYA